MRRFKDFEECLAAARRPVGRPMKAELGAAVDACRPPKLEARPSPRTSPSTRRCCCTGWFRADRPRHWGVGAGDPLRDVHDPLGSDRAAEASLRDPGGDRAFRSVPGASARTARWRAASGRRCRSRSRDRSQTAKVAFTGTAVRPIGERQRSRSSVCHRLVDKGLRPFVAGGLGAGRPRLRGELRRRALPRDPPVVAQPAQNVEPPNLTQALQTHEKGDGAHAVRCVG